MKQSGVRWTALGLTVVLLGYAAFGDWFLAMVHGRGVPRTCEERCMARDEACAPLANAQGGWPAANDLDAQAKCNGLCYVLRARGGAADPACLE